MVYKCDGNEFQPQERWRSAKAEAEEVVGGGMIWSIHDEATKEGATQMDHI